MPNIMQKDPMRKYDLRPVAVSGGKHYSPSRKEEDGRLRRLADVRSVINPHGRQAIPPPVPRTLKDPPMPLSPQALSGSASAPSLHDFATRTHLQRLDIAYEKLDTYVEQSVMQLQSGVQESIDKLKEWVESKIGTSEEKLAAALASVQSTRSVLDSAVSSLSAAQGGKNDELRARVASCEERLLANATNSAEMRERIKALDERLGKEISIDSPTSPKALGDRLNILELHLGFSIKGGSAPKALEERFKELQERLEDASSKAVEHGPELDERLKLLEEKLDTVSGHVHQCKTALEFAVGDLTEKFSDKSVEKESLERISDARYEGVQNALGELRTEMEAVRLERIALQADVKASVAGNTEFRELKCRQENFSTSLDTVAQRLQLVLGRKKESEQHVARLELKVVSEENRLSTLEKKVVSEERRLEVLEEKVVSEDKSARESKVSPKKPLDDASRLSLALKHATSIDEEAAAELKRYHGDSFVGLGSQAEEWIASLGQQYVDQLKNQAGDDQDKYYASVVALREDIERLKEKRAVEIERDRKEELSKPGRDVEKSKAALHLLAEASLSGALPQMIASDHAGRSMSRAMSINAEEVMELKTRHSNLFSGLGSQSEAWIVSLGQQCIDELKAQAKTDQEKYYASVIAFREAVESPKDALKKIANEEANGGEKNVDALRAQVKKSLFQAAKDGRFQEALAEKKWQEKISLQVPEKMSARSQIVVTKVESTEEASDTPLKAFEELLSSMAFSISSLEERFAGGGVSSQELSDLRLRVEAGFQAMLVRTESARFMNDQEARVGDNILQQFVGGMDERVKKIESMMNKNSHWIDKLMAKTGLKIKHVAINLRCECGAEFDPDVEVCSQCGEQWKAHLHEALKQKHEAHRLKKYAREFLSTKDNERKVRLLFVAFDVWARGDNAKSFKSYSEAHPRDHRTCSSRASTSSRPSAVTFQVDTLPSNGHESVADSGGRLSVASESALTPLSPVKEPSKRRFNPFSGGSRQNSVGSLPRLQE